MFYYDNINMEPHICVLKCALYFPCILLAGDLWLLHVQSQYCGEKPAQLMITLHIPINSKEFCLLTLGTNFVFWKLHKNQIFALIFDSSIGSGFILFKLVPVTISKRNKKYSVALWRIVQWKVRKADQTYFRLITESIDDFTFCQLQNWTSYSLSPTCLKHISRQMV